MLINSAFDVFFGNICHELLQQIFMLAQVANELLKHLVDTDTIKRLPKKVASEKKTRVCTLANASQLGFGRQRNDFSGRRKASNAVASRVCCANTATLECCPQTISSKTRMRKAILTCCTACMKEVTLLTEHLGTK